MLGKAGILRKIKSAIQKVQKRDAVPQSNSFTPPKGDICIINELPPELLSRIFELGSAIFAEVAESSRSNKTRSLSTWYPEFQLRVSHVCRHWRDVAISTPSLWTMIRVDPSSRPPYEYAATQLERSKSLPIDICVMGNDSNARRRQADSDIHADFENLFSMFIPHIHRWRLGIFSFRKFDVMLAFFSAISAHSTSPAANLTTIAVEYYNPKEGFANSREPDTLQHLTLFGGSAPLLTGLYLRAVRVDWAQPWIASASNLKELSLSLLAESNRPSWVQFAAILRGAPALEKLALCLAGPSGDPADWLVPGSHAYLNDPIQLPRLVVFDLQHYSQAHAIGLLRKLHMPALKCLNLFFYQGDYTEFVHELVGPATVPSPSSVQERSHSLLSGLESLRITGLPCRTECVEMLYSELRNVTSLGLSMERLPRRFLDVLGMPCALDRRGGVFLPRLKTLYVKKPSGDVVRTLVRERNGMGAPLDTLHLEEGSAVSKRDLVWLRQNVEAVEFFIGPINLLA